MNEEQFKTYGQEMSDRALFKARKGSIEHGDNFNNLTILQLLDEVLDELADLSNYIPRLRDLILEKKIDTKKEKEGVDRV